MELDVLADHEIHLGTRKPVVENNVADKEEVTITNNKTDKLPQTLAAIAANMMILSIGCLFTWTSPANPMLQRDDSPFRITDHEASWVGSLLALGSVVGGAPFGWLVNRVGRKLTMLILAIPVTMSWIIVLTTNSVFWLYIARFMSGISLGGASFVVPIYVAEVAEPSVRGFLGSITQVAYNTGILYSYAVGAIGNYTILNLACLLLPIMFILVFVWMPEAPQYYLSKDNREDAAKALQWLRGKDANVEEELQKLKDEADEAIKNEGSLRDLIKDAVVVKVMVISLGLVAGQQLSGICAVLFYTQTIFEAAGSNLSATVSSVTVGVVMLFSSFLTMKLINSFGRRTLLIVSTILQMISLLVLGLYFLLKEEIEADVQIISWLPLACLIMYITTYCQGLGPLTWVVMSEILPPKVKGIGGAILASFCWFTAFVLTNTFQSIIEFVGRYFAFWFFAVMCAASVVFVNFKVPETKGFSLQEIQQRLSNADGKSANGTGP